MIVQGINLNGFKSFEKKREIGLDFPLTAFVGPNGSGKSNVADAIRWVLGEQSMKNIRANKSEDVIFAGSTSKSPKGMAEVELKFDNGDSFFDLPYSEVAVMRRIFRDGHGEYFINGNRIRLRDLLEVMAKSGLGSFDLTVIGQGEIDQILIMGSDQIQSLLEDASGVKPFYIKKQRVIRALSHTSESIVRLHDILNELEPRLRDLRRESKQAEAYIQIKEELAGLQQTWYREQIRKLDLDTSTVRSAEAALQKQKDGIHQEIREFEQQISAISKELEGRQGALHTHQTELDDMQKELSDLWQEQASIEAKLQFNRSQTESFSARQDKSEQKGLIQKQSELQERLATLETELEQMQKQEQTLRAAIDKSMCAYQEALTKFNELSNRQSSSEGRKSLKEKLHELKGLYEKLSSKLFASKRPKLEKLQRLFSEGLHVHERIQPLLSEIVEELEDASPQESEEIIAARMQIDDLLVQSRKLQSELTALLQQRESKANQKRNIERALQDVSRKVMNSGDLRETKQKEFMESLRKEQQFLLAEQKRLEQQIIDKKQLVEAKKAQIAELFSQQRENEKLTLLKQNVFRKRGELSKLSSQEQELLIQRTRLETRREDVVQRAQQEFRITPPDLPLSGEKHTSPPDKGDLGNLTAEDLVKMEDQMIRLRGRLERIGDINQKAPAEYEEVKGRFEWLYTQLQDIEETAKFIEKELKKLDSYVEKLFEEVFADTQKHFGEYFELLFGGGEGRLEREDNVLLGEKEILIKARPPGKRMHDLNLLSGGERSMGAVALLFAILESCKTPFCVLDEVDAALDEANIGRFCQALKRLNGQAQVILVTHNRRTMEAADCLYGTTMREDGTTQIVSLRLQDYTEEEKVG